MSNLTTTTGTKGLSQFLNQSNVLDKFSALLGTKAQGFITSVISAVNSNGQLANATQDSVYASALMAATLDLPINQNLGFAYLIPYNNKKTGNQECQFQIGYKGFIQLSQRSGQFLHLKAVPTYSGDTETDVIKRITALKPFTPIGEIDGYVAYFKLLNGYEASFSMTISQLKAHANQYSQSSKKGFGLWIDNFEAMALKTVLKLLLSKFAPLSIEMQKAQLVDQSVIKDTETMDFEYVDNGKETPKEIDNAKEEARVLEFVKKAESIEDLDLILETLEEPSEFIQKAIIEAKNNLKK